MGCQSYYVPVGRQEKQPSVFKYSSYPRIYTRLLPERVFAVCHLILPAPRMPLYSCYSVHSGREDGSTWSVVHSLQHQSNLWMLATANPSSISCSVGPMMICGKVLCSEYNKEKLQAGKCRTLGDQRPVYTMNIQSLRVEKRIAWGIWNPETAYSHDCITTPVGTGDRKKKCCCNSGCVQG